MPAVDPRAPCIIGAGQRTWHPDDVGDEGAPEPLLMWDEVARLAVDDTGAGSRALDRLDSLQIVYCQTWQYDDPTQRLSARLGVSPRHSYYSGIGGTTPQVLVNDVGARVLGGELDVALVCGAEALATQRRYKRRGERYPYRFKPDERRPFPWEAPAHPAEVAHEVFQAWLTFAIFDNARRGHLGVGLDEYREGLGELFAPFTELAATNPNAWFRVARSADEIITANAPLAVQATKQSVWEGLGMSLRDAYKNESQLSSTIFQTEDAKEGPKAFREKRTPNWQGK